MEIRAQNRALEDFVTIKVLEMYVHVVPSSIAYYLHLVTTRLCFVTLLSQNGLNG